MYLMQAYLDPATDAACFTDQQWWGALLAFESQLAMAQAECGLIPESTARDIARACEQLPWDRTAFVDQARSSGALGVALTRPLQQWLAQHAPEAEQWLHWGTTTQDAVDTAHAMLTRDALAQLLGRLDVLCQQLERLARQHEGTPMLARSLMQPAQVTSFGLKCAQMLGAFRRSQAQLKALSASALCVQLGGAIGNRASYAEQGAQLESALAARLGLGVAGHAWHTQRDQWMRLGMEVALCGASLAKLAKDWSLMMQFEVGELSEAAREHTSSAMPHKRNPVHCMQAIAQTQPMPHIASLLLACMVQAHERALGEWQAEVAHWASLWQHALAASGAMAAAASGLQVNEQRMREHIDALQEVIFSEAFTQVLAPHTGADAAARLVSEQSASALAQQRPLSELLAAAAPDAQIRKALSQVADPELAAAASARACRELLKEYGTSSLTPLKG